MAFAESVTGSKFFTHCQHTLNLVKPVFESQRHFEDHDLSFLLCLIFIETTECFLRGNLPTLKFYVQNEQVVDRYLDLSLPLPPHFYDLCELSHSLSQKTEPNIPSVMEALGRIEWEVVQWRLTHPEDFLESFTQTEGMHRLAQAHMLNLTILLMIHCFRFSFGINDDKGAILPKCIMRELNSTRIVT